MKVSHWCVILFGWIVYIFAQAEALVGTTSKPSVYQWYLPYEIALIFAFTAYFGYEIGKESD